MWVTCPRCKTLYNVTNDCIDGTTDDLDGETVKHPVNYGRIEGVVIASHRMPDVEEVIWCGTCANHFGLK